MRRGWYTHAHHWAALDEWRGRPLLTLRAVQGSLPSAHVASPRSAALVHDLPVLDPRDGLVHVTKYGSPRARVRHGVKHHQSRDDRAKVLRVDGLPVLGLARTALHIAREHGFAAGVCAIDGVRQRGVTLAELETERVSMWHWRRVTTAADALAFSVGGAESIGESLTRILLDEIGLGPIETQFELRDPPATRGAISGSADMCSSSRVW